MFMRLSNLTCSSMQRAEGVQRHGPDVPSSSTQAPADRVEQDADFARVVARAEEAEASLAERVSNVNFSSIIFL